MAAFFSIQGWSNIYSIVNLSDGMYFKIPLMRVITSWDKVGAKLIGYPDFILLHNSSLFLPLKGAYPCKSSYNKIPKLQTSRLKSCGYLFSISGAYYIKLLYTIYS